MNTKCTYFCLVLATVFAIQPTHASNCSKIRELLANKTPAQQPYPSGFNVLNRSKNRQRSSAAHAVWPFRPGQLYAIVLDYDAFPEFVPSVARSRQLASSAGRAWIYQRLKLPPPFKDRHYIMESRHREDALLPGHFTVEWSLSTRFDMPHTAEPAVTPDKFSGCWDIRPTETGGVDAVYSVTFKPGGFIPDWIANAASKHYLEDLMVALHQRLSERHPAQARSAE